MAATPLTILAIDDDPGDLELLRRALEEIHEFTITFLACATLEAGQTMLAQHPVDVIVLDYLFGARTGLTMLQTLRQSNDYRPVIVLTGKGDERIAAAMMRAGADDYVIKEDLSPETVRYSLEFVLAQFASERKRVQQEEELQRLTRFDELTGLYSRRYLLERLAQEMLRAQRYGAPLSILMLDVDYFKRVNDTYGHIVGDAVLATVAGVLRTAIRATDIAGRYGGEEFCIVLPETPLAGAGLLAERLRQQVATAAFPVVPGGGLQVTCSIGVAQWSNALTDPLAFLASADRALYAAKTAGRNRVVAAGL
jgi:diguanylate cyclase (GGDEF)-like protein